MNNELAEKVMTIIEQEAAGESEYARHVGRWMQSTWGVVTARVLKASGVKRSPRSSFMVVPSCGTAGCFAGWAIQEAGFRMVVDVGAECEYLSFVHDEALLYVDSCVRVDEAGNAKGGLRKIERVAREALGLSAPQATVLFDPENTVVVLRALIDYLKIKPFASDETLAEVRRMRRRERFATRRSSGRW